MRPISDAKHYSQAVAYVCGILIKKINLSECINCKNCLLTENLEHILTMFKEFDDSR